MYEEKQLDEAHPSQCATLRSFQGLLLILTNAQTELEER